MNSKINTIQRLGICLLLIFFTGCAALEVSPEPSATTELIVITTPTVLTTETPIPIPLTWTQKTDIPTPRFGHASSVVDGKIYVIGGGGEALTKIEMYDLASDSWAMKTDMPTGRLLLSTSVVNGNIYAIGGASGPLWGSPPLTTVEMYDPATDTWSTKAAMSAPRILMATAVLDGKIYAIGGEVQTEDDEFVPTGMVEIYDPATDTWTPGKNMPITKRNVSAAVIDEKIIVCDGRDPLVYDPARDRWAGISRFPVNVTSKTCVEFTDRMVTFGGLTGGTTVPVSGVFLYDPVSNIWQQLSDMPFSAWEMSASVVDEKIFLIGGLEQSLSESFNDPQPLSSVWEVSIGQ